MNDKKQYLRYWSISLGVMALCYLSGFLYVNVNSKYIIPAIFIFLILGTLFYNKGVYSYWEIKYPKPLYFLAGGVFFLALSDLTLSEAIEPVSGGLVSTLVLYFFYGFIVYRRWQNFH
ncbi:hypothetical protein [Natranaerobius thermophilus]|nr:hypothetical protein [Natranaerobius thermophilus]